MLRPMGIDGDRFRGSGTPATTKEAKFRRVEIPPCKLDLCD